MRVWHQVPWARAEQPCPKTRSITTCLSPALKQNVLALQHWGCSLGFQRVFSQSTEYYASKTAPSAPNSRTPAFFSIDTSLLLLAFFHHASSFLSPRKTDPSMASRALQQVYSTNRGPSAVSGCLKLQENTNTTNKTWGIPSSPQQNSPAHTTWYLHTPFCCQLPHLGQKSNQVEGVVTRCSQLEVILTYSLQCRPIIDWSPGSVAVL